MKKLFKSDEEFYRGGAETYFSSEEREKVFKAFEWIGEEINLALEKSDFTRADTLLTSIVSKVRYENNNSYDNPKLYEYAKEWIEQNFELIKRVAFASNSGASRRDSGFLFIKFARFKDFRDLVELAIFLYHTLRFKDRFLKYPKQDGSEEESNYVIQLALIGIYRHGLSGLLTNLRDEKLNEIESILKDGHKKVYDEIEALESDGSNYAKIYFALKNRNEINEEIESFLREVVEGVINSDESEIIYSEIISYLRG